MKLLQQCGGTIKDGVCMKCFDRAQSTSTTCIKIYEVTPNTVEPTANEGEKTAEDFINKIEDHHIAFMEDYAGGKESHYSREGIIKAMQAYASQERSKAIQEALNLPKRKIAENNWDGVKFRPTNEEYIAVKDLEKLNQK